MLKKFSKKKPPMKQCKTCGEVYETKKTCPCPKHGGARAGSGKKTIYKKPMKATPIMLDEETIKFYKSYGKGNLSKGIRNYWRGV